RLTAGHVKVEGRPAEIEDAVAETVVVVVILHGIGVVAGQERLGKVEGLQRGDVEVGQPLPGAAAGLVDVQPEEAQLAVAGVEIRVLWPPPRISGSPPFRTSVAYPPSPWMYRSVAVTETGTPAVPGMGIIWF